MQQSVKYQLSLLLSGYIVFFVLVIYTTLTWEKQNHLQRQIYEQQKQISLQLGRTIQTFWNKNVDDIQTAGTQIERLALKAYQQHHLLTILQKNNPSILALSLFDINGQINANLPIQSHQISIHHFVCPDIFSISFYSGINYTGPIISTNKMSVIEVSFPVYFLDNSYIVGVIAARIKLNQLQTILDHYTQSSSSHIVILDNNNHLIYQSRHISRFSPDSFSQAGTDKTITIRNQDYLFASTEILLTTTPLKIAVLKEKQTALQPVKGVRQQLIILLFITVTLLIFILLSSYKNIFLPLKDSVQNKTTPRFPHKENCKDACSPDYADKSAVQADIDSSLKQRIKATSVSPQQQSSITGKTDCADEISLKGISIFLAEDEFINQRMFSTFLQQCGAEVTIVENGKKLLEALDEKSPDIILMDIRMPVMDGFQATREIRIQEGNSGNHTPIIAVTAHATNGFRERCLDAGTDEYLSKPVSFDSLLLIIQQLLERYPSEDEENS